MATARHLLETYRTDLFKHYPMVPIPTYMTAEEVRTTRPALFLAVIAAAAGKEDPKLAAILDKEVLQSYATRSLVQSEKSLERVQALLVSAVWVSRCARVGSSRQYARLTSASIILPQNLVN